MIKQLLNSVLAKYRDLSMARRSIICLCLRHRQIIDLLATDKSPYFAPPRPIIDYYFVNLLSFLFLVKRALKVKWQEKSELIGKLEKEVGNMRNNFKEKEKTLIEERDKAVNAAE